MSDRLEDIIAFRRAKLDRIKAAGIDPYPSHTNRTHTNAEALEQFADLTDSIVMLVGRIRSLRTMGKLAFFHIEDGTAKIQVLLKADDAGEDVFSFFGDNFDIGDFIEATGTLFETKTGEKTLQATSCKLLAKSLLPLPSEHYGIEDEETRLRKRYLDILLNPEVKELFVKKNKFWSSMRSFMVEHGFLELDMPVLETVPGGAEAEPFITHHNALGRDFYLRISLELPLKKMLVAGYEKVFEIGRIFRNEGISATHLQDYTQMEFYWAYADFDMLLKFWQEMYQQVIGATCGSLQVTSGELTVDWSGDWERVNYVELFKERTGIDLESAADDELKAYADEHHLKYEPHAQRGRLIDLIFKKIRGNLGLEKPIFLINQPIELEPLAKRDPKNPKIVQRAQLIAYGSELGKGFGELNDPIDQRERFEAQSKLREAGDVEAQMMDEGYVEAMEYGMPPAAGFGVSERLFSMLVGKTVRETVIFPPMREEQSPKSSGKSKQSKMAVAFINKSASMESWQELNTVAHLTASFAARAGTPLLLQDEITTQDHEKIKLNVQHAIMIKIASSNEAIKNLRSKAKDAGLEISEFIREMIETTDDKKVIEWAKQKDFTDVEYLGLLVFGDRKTVEALTSEFPLYS